MLVQVTLAGVSYEATAALVTIAQQHRAVRGAIAMYPFWDLYTDINLPGGIHQHRFIAGAASILTLLFQRAHADTCAAWTQRCLQR